MTLFLLRIFPESTQKYLIEKRGVMQLRRRIKDNIFITVYASWISLSKKVSGVKILRCFRRENVWVLGIKIVLRSDFFWLTIDFLKRLILKNQITKTRLHELFRIFLFEERENSKSNNRIILFYEKNCTCNFLLDCNYRSPFPNNCRKWTCDSNTRLLQPRRCIQCPAFPAKWL